MAWHLQKLIYGAVHFINQYVFHDQQNELPVA